MASRVPNKIILDWVSKRRVDLTEDGLISRFELWHATDGEFGERLGLYDMETREEDEDPADLVQEIWNDACQDADTRPQGSYQRYVVKAFRGPGDTPDEMKAFPLHGAAVTGSFGGTESPTPRGMMGQEMRMSDNLHGMMMRMAEGTSGQLARQLEEKNKENAELLLQRSRLLEIEQRLLDRQHERDMDKAERAKSGERWDMVMGMITTLGPLVLAKLFEGKALPGAVGAVMGGLGGGGIPGSGMGGLPGGAPPGAPSPATASPQDASAQAEQARKVRRVMARDQGIGNLLGTLTQEQLQGLAGVLRPDQAMGFLEIYQDFHAEHAGSESKGNSHGSEEAH